jgi:hypothetical protein
VTALCNNGLETNMEDGWGNTPLLAALLSASTLGADVVTPIACALITAGATVNGTSNTGKPAVLLAVEAGLAQVLALMITKGVHTNVKCSVRVESPLHVALQCDPIDTPTISMLLKVMSFVQEPRTPLTLCCFVTFMFCEFVFRVAVNQTVWIVMEIHPCTSC